MMASPIREKLCIDLLADIERKDPASSLQDLVGEFTLWDILESSQQPVQVEDSNGISKSWTGLLSQEDIMRFGLPPRFELSPLATRRLEDELDTLLLSISDFFHADKIDGISEQKRMGMARALPEHIQSRKIEIQDRASQMTITYGRIETLIVQINESHAQLQKDLSDALTRFPSDINERNLSLNDLLAATIETSLIKLSLLRARAHQALYGFKSSTQSQSSMTGALSSAYAALKKEERKLDEETRALDRQTEEYEAVLKLVDGGGGGFAQVVADWTRVQKEKEECKRDLRRLGWTGD